ncbi:eukaryotic translation initiation factor 3 subunit J [Podospora fimiseda]|uniref:Eukaryotic translation initiation factor 3 subunit J n=1 Tax=Podospora fimiseda TaxID=252190 RepID=A0AAN7BQV5_9PEZI|nr:eukaryotic translation initiation factor 3 subunit J [Podospora fimiseda]
MPPKKWDDEEENSSGSESETAAIAAGRRKFDDEEGDDSDVLDSWDAADDSEVEREKAKKAAEAKAKADAEAAANKKSKAQRIEEKRAERARQLAEDDDSEEETEAQKRERLRRTEKEADLAHAEDLFGSIGISKRKANASGSIVQLPGNDPNNTVDLSTLPIFNPTTKSQFEALRNATAPLIASNFKKAHFVLFAQEYFKQIIKECKSDEIKKIASTLTALSNEKMKEEKAAEKGGKKTKAAKTKTSLAGVSRGGGVSADVHTYDDNEDFGE